MKKNIAGIGAIIVSIVVILSIVTALLPTAQTEGDSLNDSNRCTAVGCYWNNSRTTLDCTANNYTEGDGVNCETSYQVPLSSLFGSSGVVFIILVIGIFMTITGLKKQKK